jgi:hypothetical protein
MKVPIQSGNVSKRETIEVLIESARTGILSAFTMADYSVFTNTLNCHIHDVEENI